MMTELHRWRKAALLKDRTRAAIRERFVAGESVTSLADDFDIPDEFVSGLIQWQIFADEESARANAQLYDLAQRGAAVSGVMSSDVQTAEQVAEVVPTELGTRGIGHSTLYEFPRCPLCRTPCTASPAHTTAEWLEWFIAHRDQTIAEALRGSSFEAKLQL